MKDCTEKNGVWVSETEFSVACAVLPLVSIDFVFIAKKTDKQEKLVLCHLNDKVLHILKLANMVDRFSITKNVDEAMTFLNKVMD